MFTKNAFATSKEKLAKKYPEKVRMPRTFEHNSSRKFPTLNKT
jgi:hypothetical protein